MKGFVYSIPYRMAIDFLLPRHYSGRAPQVKWAYGWFSCKYKEGQSLEDINNKLKAVITIGKPASHSLCKGICGEEYSDSVYELNRVCRVEDWQEPLSQFLGAVLRRSRYDNIILVSYADTGMNHTGYLYQATNWLYTGITKERTDKYTDGNKHSRHYNVDDQNGLRKLRTSKHRYVYFCTQNKKLKKQWEASLNYPTQDYPKGENKNYILGEYQKPIIINKEKRSETQNSKY